MTTPTADELRPDLSGQVDEFPHSSRLCRILALSGGGYRGLFTARILGHLERQAGRSVKEIFDLIIGTSTGALLGAAIALGTPASAIEKAYVERGPLIFARRRFGHSTRRFLFSAPYGLDALYASIRELIGKDIANTALRNLDINFVATAVSHTREQVRVFGSGKFARGIDDITTEDAIVASAAAPTYFPSKRYKNENLVDGGLVANAPELLGVTLAKSILGTSIEDIRVLAIGTACPAEGLLATGADTRGILRWLLSARGLVRVTMAAQEHLTRQLTKQLLGDNYLIIDKAPAADQIPALADMDNTSQRTTDTLLVLAEMAWAEFVDNSRHRVFL